MGTVGTKGRAVAALIALGLSACAVSPPPPPTLPQLDERYVPPTT
jgi:hypothetical protein